MKRKFGICAALSIWAIFGIIGAGCEEKDTKENLENDEAFKFASYNLEQADSLTCSLDYFPYQELSNAEITELEFMREEEKLARDVYTHFHGLYAMPVFLNISKSEQQHTSAVKSVINKYGLVDPVETDIPGAFTNPELQNLYTSLIDQGEQSLIEALKAGAFIEETDILDLKNAIENSDNEDIRFVYNNLKRASGYHLKAFVGVLKFQGIDYIPVELDDDTFKKIVGEI